MKKLYYFSSSKLQFVEVKNFKKKLILYFVTSVFVLTATVYGTLYFITHVTGSGKSLSALRQENKFLQGKLEETAGLYKQLDSELDSLMNVNNTLRIAANLPPLSDEEKKVGVGGGYFDNDIDSINSEIGTDLKEALSGGWPGFVIDERFGLEAIADAHEWIEERKGTGRVVLDVGSN